MEVMSSIAVLLLLSCSLTAATAPAGTIERVSKQQILASIPPGGHASPPVLFLTSPSGKYAAYFVRTHTAPGAGGLGADFCYVEVMAGGEGEGGGSATHASAWESECRPVSTVNTCTLLFSWHGLEVFDGAEEVWHGETNTDGTNFLQTLELVDDGDMRVRDKDGELAWRASDEPRHAQHCGAPGSPGLAAALPPFAEPIGAHSSSGLGDGYGYGIAPTAGGGGGVAAGAGAGPLGDGYGIAPGAGTGAFDGTGDMDGQGAAATAAGAAGGVAGAAVFGSQPLVDNSPYDSGAYKGSRGARLAAIGTVVFVGAIAVGF
ncbi:unnamed protein product [Triticum aestivum]|uniref:non-specific serine/threonine protein kinase n=1 Tax=Triticum aestivum TaxID=4565 RepID=A0A7H4LD14_WHEAT|nr:unnamed protein product [Triticum aestivum]